MFYDNYPAFYGEASETLSYYNIVFIIENDNLMKLHISALKEEINL